MNQVKLNKLIDLLNDVKKVDVMVRLHVGDSFMRNQYEAEKNKLISFLIDELVSPSVLSESSLHTVWMLIDKFYNPSEMVVDDKLSKLEMAISPTVV
jgi:hypothetical protein